MHFWQQSIWEELIKRHTTAVLAHALLFCGPEGLGKKACAIEFAQFILCQRPGGDCFCGNCASCLLMKAGTHPDFSLVVPEGPGKQIKIDQIRTLSDDLSKTSSQGGYKVAVIAPADAMNLAAANALLKTLEEPEGKTLIILVSSIPQTLPATIRSRSQRQIFALPELLLARGWLAKKNIPLENIDTFLAMADMSPLRALEFAGHQDLMEFHLQLLRDLVKLSLGEIDPLVLAKQYMTADFKFFFASLIKIITKVIKLGFYLEKHFFIGCDPKEKELLCALLARSDVTKLFLYLDKIQKLNKVLQDGINLNKQLMLEDLFLFNFGGISHCACSS